MKQNLKEAIFGWVLKMRRGIVGEVFNRAEALTRYW